MSNLSKAAATTTTTKIQIEQNVPCGSIRKGPYAIERSVDPNDVVIKRRFGEGSKPLFQRDDIAVNREHCTETCSNKPQANDSAKAATVHQWHNDASHHSSSKSSSPERFRKRNKPQTPPSLNQSHYHHDENSSKHKVNSKDRTRTAPSTRHLSSEKVPYFLDEVRERDRLQRIYGSNPGKTPPVIKQRRHFSKSRSRSLSRSPTKRSVRAQHRNTSATYRTRSNSRGRHGTQTSTKRRSSHGAARRRSRTPERRRSRSLDEWRGSRERHSHSYSARHPTSVRRRRSSRSHSRTRSRDRERDTRDNHNSDRRKEHTAEHESTVQTAPHIITIPVPVPADYAYGYPSWPASQQWGAGVIPPQRYASYPMPALLPAPIMPTMRPPPPYGLPPPYYGGHMYRPQQPRYGAPRPPRANHRPRNY